EIGSRLEPGKMYSDETLKPPRARTNEKSKLFYLFKIRPELVDNFKGSVLYLGAGSGTTVKKLAKISKTLYCVELSPFPFASLIEVAKREKRKNIYPIIEDANKPESYADVVKKPNLVYQDITQKNQVEIFLKNMSFFSVKKGVLMIKASSIDSMKPANLVFEDCRKTLGKEGYKTEIIDLRENFGNHAAIIAEKI
ncbi:MAG: fibrillarin-like rRNA/tRNA 2'-O-methyltransferase, partial [Candidatus Thermoplasmatota archaeon]|nr:fibrillarin-like rRNA/tRNA 2'-O-methyltransferase [Candidatus Thermoplasmatota archaeon]